MRAPVERLEDTFRGQRFAPKSCTPGTKPYCSPIPMTEAVDTYHRSEYIVSRIRIRHRRSGEVLADGPVGWGITPFEGNLYIGRKHLETDAFEPNFIPGFCPYKFLYVWMDLKLPGEDPVKNAGWMYWLPNPLLPFIAFRVAVPRDHPGLEIEEYEAAGDGAGRRTA